MLKLTKLISDKTLTLIVAILVSSLIAVLSLMRTDSFPSVDLEGSDKIYHAIAYFVLGFSWHWYYMSYTRQNTKIKFSLSIYALTIIFGIVIEVLQSNLTSYRSFDVNDMIANAFGSGLATLIFVSFLNKIKFKKQKFS